MDDFMTGPQSDEFIPDFLDFDADDELPCETMEHYPDAVGYPENDEDSLLPF